MYDNQKDPPVQTWELTNRDTAALINGVHDKVHNEAFRRWFVIAFRASGVEVRGAFELEDARSVQDSIGPSAILFRSPDMNEVYVELSRHPRAILTIDISDEWGAGDAEISGMCLRDDGDKIVSLTFEWRWSR